MSRYSHAVLLSGGLDSTVLLRELTANAANRVKAVHINGGSASALHQLHYSKLNCNQLGVPVETVDMRGLQGLMAGYVPPELAGIDDFDSQCPYDGSVLPLLIASAAYHCQVSDTPILSLGLTREQANPNTQLFLHTLSQAMNLFDANVHPVAIEAPLLALTKDEVILRGAVLGVDFTKTWTCFLNGRNHCGTCGPCLSRKAAFKTALLQDPTVYLA